MTGRKQYHAPGALARDDAVVKLLSTDVSSAVVCFVDDVVRDRQTDRQTQHTHLCFGYRVGYNTVSVSTNSRDSHCSLIICPVAVAYSIGQIIKPVCVCASVCLSACAHSHDRIYWSIFTKIVTDVKPPTVRTSSLGQHRTTLPLVCSRNPNCRPRGPENSCKYRKPYICLKCTQIAEIFASFKNLGRGTRWRCQILNRK